MCTPLYYRRVWGRMDTCVCMTEPLCFSPETITTLLTDYTPIQIKSQNQKRVQRATQPSFCHTKTQEVSTLRPRRGCSPEPDPSAPWPHASASGKVLVTRHAWLFVTPSTAARQTPLSMGFSRPEYWSALPFPSPGDLPDPGIEPRSPALQAGFFFFNA